MFIATAPNVRRAEAPLCCEQVSTAFHKLINGFAECWYGVLITGINNRVAKIRFVIVRINDESILVQVELYKGWDV